MLKKSQYTIYGPPKAKARPRAARHGDGVRVYNSQKMEMGLDRIEVMQQMRSHGHLQRLREPISVSMRFHMGGANKVQTRRLNGRGKPNKPDIDNLAKYYLDVLNELVYDDDRFITELWCEKIFSDKPKVEIWVNPAGGKMINEHVMTVKNELSLEELNYMVRKANRLGKRDRELIRCFMEEDDEGKHYYFECEGMKPLAKEKVDEDNSNP